jgi:hypothetical protein
MGFDDYITDIYARAESNTPVFHLIDS